MAEKVLLSEVVIVILINVKIQPIVGIITIFDVQLNFVDF